MKHVTLIILILLLAIGATGALAQPGGFAPNPTAQPPDSDGDGLRDPEDGCPNQAGPRTNKGCPEITPSPQPPPTGPTPTGPPADSDGDGVIDTSDQCPSEPGLLERAGCPEPDTDGDGFPDVRDECPAVPGSIDTNGCPPFTPPTLPADACFITPATRSNVNVRQLPDLTAPVVGSLFPGVVYEAEGYVIKNGTDIWFVLKNYELNVGVLPGTIGFSARVAVLASTCTELNAGASDSAASDDLASNEGPDGPGVIDPLAMQCATKPGTTLVEACWCPTNDGDCVNQLVSICYGGNSYIEEGPDTTACWFEDDGEETRINDLVQREDDGPDVGGRIIFVMPDDSSNANGPFSDLDCNTNGIPDPLEHPAPDCATDDLTIGDTGNTEAQEDPIWWINVLPLMCGGGPWFINAVPYNFNGDYMEFTVIGAGCL